MMDNKLSVNKTRVEMIAVLAKRTMDILVSTSDDKLLATPNNGDKLTSFNSDLDDIIFSKLRKKFNLG